MLISLWIIGLIAFTYGMLKANDYFELLGGITVATMSLIMLLTGV